MQLTKQEKLALKKIEREELLFQKLKKLNAALCVLLLALAVWFMSLLGDIPREFEGRADLQAIIYSVAVPTLFLFCGALGYLIGATFKNWRGNPERVLLIALLKKSQANESEPAGTGQPMQTAQKSENHLNH